MHRPKRACTERTRQKIQEILQWEACKENSQMFKDAEAQMERELRAEGGSPDYAPCETSESEDNDDGVSVMSDCETETECVEKKDEPFEATVDE
jgi:predicted P-loop ATPase